MAYASKQMTNAPITEGQWQVWLEGEFRERAQRTIQEIAVALTTVSHTETKATTLAEIALFYGYLASPTGDDAEADRALDFLNAAIQGVGRKSLPAYFIGGYPQVGWVLTQLAGKLFAPEEVEACQAVDEALVDYLQNLPQFIDYDLIGGLVGIGVYALARLPEPGALTLLELVLKRLAERAEASADGLTWHTAPELLPSWQREHCPNGYYNLGLAHGLPGVIVLLARACKVEAVRAQARPMLEEAVRWLLAHLEDGGGVPTFPFWVAEEAPSRKQRLAWCYGDLGAAAALLYTARLVGKDEWEELALRVLRKVAKWRDEEEAGVIDAGICHGAAGNAHLFNRLYQATGETLFGDAARYWYERLLDFRQPEADLGGFLTLRQKEDGESEWVPCADFLNGAAGVGLVLLAATRAETPSWDECLLISLPLHSFGTLPKTENN
jgi:lantibiotic biosynthesis protein